MGIQWRDSLAIGVEAIDNQHKELLLRFDGLLKACEEGRGKEEMKRLLSFLEEYVHTHFRDEEALQRLHRFPGYKEHCAQHTYFEAQIKALRAEINDEGLSMHHVIQTNNLLLKWLLNHISRVDKELGAFFKASNP